MNSIASSVSLTDISGRIGPKISLKENTLSSARHKHHKSPSAHSLAHEGVVPRDVLHDCRRDIAIPNVRLAAEDDGSARIVEQALDAHRVVLGDDARERG